MITLQIQANIIIKKIILITMKLKVMIVKRIIERIVSKFKVYVDKYSEMRKLIQEYIKISREDEDRNKGCSSEIIV